MRRWLCALALLLAALPARAEPSRWSPISPVISSPSPPASPAPRWCCSARPTGRAMSSPSCAGPSAMSVVRRKRRVAGIWINSPQRDLRGCAELLRGRSAAARSTSIAPANAQALSQIGIANLRIDPRDPRHQAGRDDDLPRGADRRAEARASLRRMSRQRRLPRRPAVPRDSRLPRQCADREIISSRSC